VISKLLKKKQIQHLQRDDKKILQYHAQVMIRYFIMKLARISTLST